MAYRRTSLALLAALLAIAQFAASQDARAPRTASSPALSHSNPGPSATLRARDREFLQQSMLASVFAIRAAQSALRNASSDDVLELAQRIADDQTQALQMLKVLARAKGMNGLTDRLDTKHAHDLQRLDDLAGDDFDLRYCVMTVSNHMRDLRTFRTEAEQGEDSDLRQFAADMTIALQNLLAMAVAVQKATAIARRSVESSVWA